MRLPHFVCLAVSSAAFAMTAAAAPLTFDSNAASTSYLGYSASSAAPSTGVAAPTYNIGTGGVWADPVGASSWVSFDPNTQPGGTNAQTMLHAPNGYYTYAANIMGEAAGFGSLTVMADDTVAVYLNGLEILAAAPGPYVPVCATQTPTCTTPVTVALSGLISGINKLTFVVVQGGDYATGLDYTGTTMTPEPDSLLLLGTGLLGSAGAMLRRFRRV